jgi:hypothetical protein
MPRPTKLTQTIQDALCWRLANGDTFKGAWRSVGVSPQAAHEWRQRGEGRHPTRPPTPRYVAFAQAIAALMPDELSDVADGESADAPEVKRRDTSKSEHRRAASEHVPNAAPPEPTTSHHVRRFEHSDDGGFAEPQNSGETGDVSPRAWLSQRSRRGLSLADKAF